MDYIITALIMLAGFVFIDFFGGWIIKYYSPSDRDIKKTKDNE